MVILVRRESPAYDLRQGLESLTYKKSPEAGDRPQGCCRVSVFR